MLQRLFDVLSKEYQIEWLTQKKGELRRHAGPLYLKDLNGCNDARECSSSGTPIPLRLTNTHRNRKKVALYR